jgi:transcriptional regulator with XRE-family HTH domain
VVCRKRNVPHGPINDLMVKAGLTQTEFAEKIGVHKTVVNHWVCQDKNPRMDRLPTVAKALEVDLDVLVKKLTSKSTRRAA